MYINIIYFVILSCGLTIDYLKIVYGTPVSLVIGCILLEVLYRDRKNIYDRGRKFDVRSLGKILDLYFKFGRNHPNDC